MNEQLTKFGISDREQEELIKVNKLTQKNIQKILNGTPIQHIIGYVEFYGYKIRVNKKVLIPRYETETLVEKTLNYIKKYHFENLDILDLCTGSGCISVALSKQVNNANILATDISQQALKTALLNFEHNHCDIKIKRSNLFKKINGKFDLIITNPPYLPVKEPIDSTVQKDPKLALFSGKEGLNHIRKILKKSNKFLKQKSILAMEIHPTNKLNIIKIIKQYFPGNIKYVFEKDLSGKTRYLFILKNVE